MKKKILQLLIILVVFLSINVNAQWKQLDFTGGTTKGIVLLNDTLFVLSASGIYRSSDLGFNWTEVNNKEIIEKIDTLNSYQFFGEGNIFTCNNKLYFSKLNRLLYSTDYGNSWNRLYPPNSTLGTRYYSIKDSLFAYTFDSLILYKLINNQWEIVIKNKRGSDLFQTEPNNIFSYDFTRLNFPLERSNNGVVYSQVFTKGLPIYDSVLVDLNYEYRYNLSAFGGNSEFLFLAVNDTKVFYKSTNDLFNIKNPWTLISTTIPKQISDIYKITFIDSMLYVNFKGKDQKFYCYKSNNFGKNWEISTTCDYLPELIINNNYYRTSYNGVSFSSDKGITWSTLKKNIKAVDISFIKSNKHRLFTYDNSNNHFLISDDKGESWNIPLGIDSNTYTFPGGLIFTDSILIVNCNSKYYKSYDNGSTWEMFNLTINSEPVVDVYPTKFNGFLLFTYNKINKAYRVFSSINLVNFNEKTDKFPFNPEYLTSLVSDSNFIYITDRTSNVLYKSNDLTNWIKESIPNKNSQNYIYSFYEFNNKIIACTYSGVFAEDFKFYVKNNNNWIELPYTGLGDRRRPQPIIHSNGVYFTTDRWTNNIYHSRDMQNWYLIDPTGLNSDVYIYESGLAAMDSIVYIGTRNYGLFKSSIIVSSINSIKSNTTINVYPNPAINTIKVDGIFEVNSYYKIYSLQGNLVQQGVFENQINIEHLINGFYHISIEGEKSVSHSNFIKQ